MTAPPPSVAPGRPSPRLARTQGRPPASPRPRHRRSERFIKTVSAVIAVVVVVFLVGGGAYLASREYFFVGTNSQGIVTIYRGFPYDLPFGIHMYEQWYVSGVPIGAIPADRRTQLLNHQLRSQNNAVNLIHSAELGQLSR
jgi:protein phosphatase